MTPSQPGEEPQSYEEACEQDANQTYYYEVGEIPVKKVFNETGTRSDRYGWKDGQWVLGYPSDDMFMRSGREMNKDEFANWTKQRYGTELK
jgi:hypothetical protein